MTIGALAGAQLTHRADMATLPIASMFLGTALAMFPASSFMANAGRRAGFVLGAALGVTGGMVAAAGIWFGSWPCSHWAPSWSAPIRPLPSSTVLPQARSRTRACAPRPSRWCWQVA
ncbi:hypothetical protein NWF32_21760 [Pseudomonas qingdaonensis]|nr:hypothetical protein [Pseudomonas qingdaonensis]